MANIDDEIREAQRELESAIRYGTTEQAIEAKIKLQTLRKEKKLWQGQTGTAQGGGAATQQTKTTKAQVESAKEQEEVAEARERTGKAQVESAKEQEEVAEERGEAAGAQEEAAEEQKRAARGGIRNFFSGAFGKVKSAYDKLEVTYNYAILPLFFVFCAVVYYLDTFTLEFPLSTRLVIYQGIALWASLSLFKRENQRLFLVFLLTLGLFFLQLYLNNLGSPTAITISRVIATFSSLAIGLAFSSIPFGLSFIAIVAPQLKMFSDSIIVDWIGILVLSPIWLWFLVVVISPQIPEEGFTTTRFMFRAILTAMIVAILIMGFAFPGYTMDAYTKKYDTEKFKTQATSYFKQGLQNFWATLTGKTREAYTRQMDIATGGMWSQNVDKQNIKNWYVTVSGVGVFDSDKPFDPGQQATIRGTFFGRLVEEYDDPNYGEKIGFGCRIRNEDLVGGPYDGTAEPEQTALLNLLLEGQTGKTPVLCKTENTFSGQRDREIVEIFGDVHLTLLSTLDVEFMHPLAKSALLGTSLRQKARPATGGPIAIAIEVGDTYPVQVEDEIKVLIITLNDDNIQQGRIQKINLVEVTLPKGLELVPSKIIEGMHCSYFSRDKAGREQGGFLEATPSKDKENTWDLHTSGINPAEDGVTLNCNSKFQKSGEEYVILSKLSKVKKQIKVQTDINYEIIGAAAVDVRELPESARTGVGNPDLSVTEITVDDAEQVEKYLEGSKLDGYGNKFYQSGRAANIDPAFAVAVARQESSLGNSDIAKNCNNPFGMKKGTSSAGEICGYNDEFRKFVDYNQAIDEFYKYINRKYVNNGLVTPNQIGPVYCPGCTDWPQNVANFRAAIGSGNWRWPLPESYNRITAVYGQYDSYHKKAHSGVDIAAPIDTPVYAVADGNVIYRCSGYCEGYGNTITVQHGSDYVRYSHLSSININKGQSVTKGKAIASSGNTGYSSGPHLDIKVYPSKPADFQYETPIDPLTKYSVGYLRGIDLQWPTNEYALKSQKRIGWT